MKKVYIVYKEDNPYVWGTGHKQIVFMSENELSKRINDLERENFAQSNLITSQAKRIKELEKENEILRRNKDVDEGFYIPPTNSDRILRCAEIFERIESADRENVGHLERIKELEELPKKILRELKQYVDEIDFYGLRGVEEIFKENGVEL